jgi:N-acetylmuramoyl-L-alanine amidase
MKLWQVPVPDYTSDPFRWPDLLVVASTILGEAEGENMLGKRAVAHVIMNRAADARWPDTPAEVCLQRLQFSAWNEGSPRYKVMLKPQEHTTEQVWTNCFRAAAEAMWRTEPDPTCGANHYLAPGSLPKLPVWAKPDKIVAKLGDHQFYRL